MRQYAGNAGSSVWFAPIRAAAESRPGSDRGHGGGGRQPVGRHVAVDRLDVRGQDAIRLVPDPDVAGAADAPIELPPRLKVGVVTVPRKALQVFERLASRLDRIVDAAPMLEMGLVRSLMPAAIGRGLVTASDAHALIARLHDSVAEDPDRPLLWPLLLGAWKRKGSSTARGLGFVHQRKTVSPT